MSKRKLPKDQYDPYHSEAKSRYDVTIPSREWLYQNLASSKRPKSIEEIMQLLHCEDGSSYEPLRRRLRAMVRDQQLMESQKSCYRVVKPSRLIKAQVRILRNGSVILLPADPNLIRTVQLNHRQGSGLMQSDEVLLRYFPEVRGNVNAYLVCIEARAQKDLVGYVREDAGRFLLQTMLPITSHPILLVQGDAKVQADDFVRAKIIDYPTDQTACIAEVEQCFGGMDSPSIVTDVIAGNFNLAQTFSKQALDQADEIHAKGVEIDSARTDWRQKKFITIDGADARDFDDAICVERCDDHWRLYVAISDVSHYIQPDTALDKAAYQRATSVYLPNVVLPMLPSVLSDGLCSLCPHVDRLVKGIEIQLGFDGHVQSYQFHRGVIHSQARLTYTQAQNIIDQQEDAPQWLVTLLQEAKNVYQVLEQLRQKRGALEIELPYIALHYDKNNKITSMSMGRRITTHKLIEEFMLLANQLTAGFLLQRKKTALFRNHAQPDQERLAKLVPVMQSNGIQFRIGKGTHTPTRVLRKAICQLAELDQGDLFIPLVLSCLAQACYEVSNVGHYGLAYEHYCHFTSPIRRYPDLLVHRALDQVLKEHSVPLLQHGLSLKTCAKHCSTQERIADDAQKKALAWLKCHFLRKAMGQQLYGTITMVKGFGFFVSLDDYHMDGLVHVRTLGDYYHYDDRQLTLTNQSETQRFHVGKRVCVVLRHIDIFEQSVDLTLVN